MDYCQRLMMAIMTACGRWDKWGMSSEGLARLSDAEQTLILVWALSAEVENGGFDLFYMKSTGDFAGETVDALRRIGDHHDADLLEEGNALFPTQPVPKDQDKRVAELKAFNEDWLLPQWGRLERAFYANEEERGRMLYEYVKARWPSSELGDCRL